MAVWGRVWEGGWEVWVMRRVRGAEGTGRWKGGVGGEGEMLGGALVWWRGWRGRGGTYERGRVRLCEGRRVSDGWMRAGAAVLRWGIREMEARAVTFMFEGMSRDHAGLSSLLYGLHVLLWRCASLADGSDSRLYSKGLTGFCASPSTAYLRVED